VTSQQMGHSGCLSSVSAILSKTSLEKLSSFFSSRRVVSGIGMDAMRWFPSLDTMGVFSTSTAKAPC